MSPAEIAAIRQGARATREALLLRRARAAARGERADDLGADVERLTRHVLALTGSLPAPSSFAALADLDLTSADGFTTVSARLQSAACGPGAPHDLLEAAGHAADALREAQRALAVAREAARVALGRLDVVEKRSTGDLTDRLRRPISEG